MRQERRLRWRMVYAWLPKRMEDGSYVWLQCVWKRFKWQPPCICIGMWVPEYERVERHTKSEIGL